jgi:AraC family transcriptional regulator
MEVKRITIEPKILVGMHLQMTFGADATPALWKQFMPLRKAIPNTITEDLFAVQIYPAGYGPMQGRGDILFVKWAAMEVGIDFQVPPGMDVLHLPAGDYAVFEHIGPASAFFTTFNFIFNEWLPANNLETDDRPHFEVLPPYYSPVDPKAKEEIWIPIKIKA